MKVRSIITVLMLLLIVGFVAAVCFVNFNGHPKPMIGATRATIASLITALDVYQADHGTYPDPEVGLDALLSHAHADPSSRTSIPTDAWGTPFQYFLADERPHIRSAGPDMKFQTEDDITN